MAHPAFRLTPEQFADCNAGKRIVVPEREVLADIIELLKRHPKVAWVARANVGAGYLLPAQLYRRLVAAGYLQAGDARYMTFGFPGAADINGMLRGGRRIEVEVKAEDGVLSPEQRRFGEAVNGGGGLWLQARSLDDVVGGLAG